jgi:hypothetical protein
MPIDGLIHRVPQQRHTVHGAAWGRAGPHRAAWGLAWGPSKKMKLAQGRKKKKARGRLLFAALELGQQPTGTAIKVPHPYRSICC